MSRGVSFLPRCPLATDQVHGVVWHRKPIAGGNGRHFRGHDERSLALLEPGKGRLYRFQHSPSRRGGHQRLEYPQGRRRPLRRTLISPTMKPWREKPKREEKVRAHCLLCFL